MKRPFLIASISPRQKAPGQVTVCLRIPGSLHMDKDMDAQRQLLRLRCRVCNVGQTFHVGDLDPLAEVRLQHLPNCELGRWIDDPANRTCSDDDARQWIKEANDIAQRIAQAERS